MGTEERFFHKVSHNFEMQQMTLWSNADFAGHFSSYCCVLPVAFAIVKSEVLNGKFLPSLRTAHTFVNYSYKNLILLSVSSSLGVYAVSMTLTWFRHNVSIKLK